MSTKELTSDFISNTTIHGLAPIQISKGFVKKVFWLAVTIAAAVFMTINMVSQILKYFSYPITVEISVAHAKGINFPAVTICNINPIKKTAFLDFQSSSRKKRSTDAQHDITCCCSCCATYNGSENHLKNCDLCQVNQLMKKMCQQPTTTIRPPVMKITSPTKSIPTQPPTTVTTTTTTTTKESKVTKTEYKNAELLTEQIVKLTPEERKSSGYSIDDMILNCSYAGSNCDPNHFVRIDNPIHGNCYIFNSGWAHKELQSYKTGRRYGLVMVINVNQEEYVNDAGDIAGVRVQVHPGYELPFPEDQGILVGPGHSTSITLQKMVLSRVGGKYSDCVDETDSKKLEKKIIYNELYTHTNYTQTACQRSCYQGNVIEQCKCADPYYPFKGSVFGSENWTVCSVENNTQQSCMKRVLEDYNNNRISCHCPVVCRQTSYSTSISIGVWPSKELVNDTLKYLKSKLPYEIDGNDYKNNLLVLEIFFDRFNFQVISESPGYEVSQLLSDIGGVIGLYMGMSFMSILELIEFFIKLASHGCKRAVEKMKGSPSEKEENEEVPTFHMDTLNFEGLPNRSSFARKMSDSARDVLLKF